jgi:hypothetical protein
VLLIEAKRLTSGEKKTKVTEIIDDYKRLRTWPDRAVGRKPLFFDLYMQVERAVSALVVVIPDEADVSAVLPDQPTFSEWWEILAAQPPGYDTNGIDELKRIIAPMKRGVLRSPFIDGGTRLTMVYALLGRELTTEDEESLVAKHEAAHVIVAWRLALPVRFVSIEEYESEEDDALDGRTLCEWQTLHGSMDSRSLCTNAFAAVYAGAWLEATIYDEPFSDAYERLATDSRAAEKVRQCLMTWEGIDSSDTQKESMDGAELARSIVQQEMPRIERLAEALLTKRFLDEEALKAWFLQDVAQHG